MVGSARHVFGLFVYFVIFFRFFCFSNTHPKGEKSLVLPKRFHRQLLVNGTKWHDAPNDDTVLAVGIRSRNFRRVWSLLCYTHFNRYFVNMTVNVACAQANHLLTEWLSLSLSRVRSLFLSLARTRAHSLFRALSLSRLLSLALVLSRARASSLWYICVACVCSIRRQSTHSIPNGAEHCRAKPAITYCCVISRF